MWSTRKAGTATTADFRLVGIPEDVLDAIRRGAPDAWGRPAEKVTAEGGEPVRCCRRDAEDGQPLLLFAFRPAVPGTGSPYQEAGAVFVHAEPCPESAKEGEYPADWRARPQVLRAYDYRGWIHPATRVHDGTEPERHLRDVLATPGVVELHSRNIGYGCWMFTAVPG
jgi:hypothetical protein